MFTVFFRVLLLVDDMAMFTPPVPLGRSTHVIDESITTIISAYFTEEQISFFDKKDELNRRHVKTVSELKVISYTDIENMDN